MGELTQADAIAIFGICVAIVGVAWAVVAVMGRNQRKTMSPCDEIHDECRRNSDKLHGSLDEIKLYCGRLTGKVDLLKEIIGSK